MGGVIKGIGKAVGSIPSGIGHALATSGIPIVSGVGNTVEGVGKSLQGKQPLLKGLLPAAAMGLGGAGLLGAGPLSGLSGTVGKALGNTFAPGGNLDLGKVISAGGAVANLAGAGQQRKSAQDYSNAQIAQRNALMSKILAPQNYGTPNMNQQSGATPGVGSGTTGGY